MSPKVEVTLRFGVGALILYLGVSGLLRPELAAGEVFLRGVQLLVAGYCFWTGLGVLRRERAKGPPGAPGS